MLIVSIILALIAAHLFASEFESVSQTEALEDENNPKRYLELGWTGRLALATVPVLALVILYIVKVLTKTWIPESILTLVLAAALAAGYVLLKFQGFGVLKTFCLLFIAVTLLGSDRNQFNAGEMTIWAIVYSILISAIFILTLILAIVMRNYDPEQDVPNEDDFDDYDEAPIYKVVKIVGAIAAVVLVFALGYLGCTHLIVPKL